MAKEENTNPFEVCDNFLNTPHGAYTISGEWKIKFDRALKTMFELITKMENEESTENFVYTEIEECLNLIKHLTIERKHNTDLIDFIKAFIFIAHNTNENTLKYDGVREKIKYLQRYCDNTLTYSELLTLSKGVSGRLEGWKQYSPPSFRLSGHYYNLLKGD